MLFDHSKISNVIVACINPMDYPDFSDAYIESAFYDNKPMTNDQLDLLNEDSDLVHEYVIEQC